MAVDFSILKTSNPIAVGDNFLAVIALMPADFVMLGAIQVFLSFDPTVLQVVPGTHPSGPIQPGTPVECNRFQDVLVNSIDNVIGETRFAAGKGLSGLDVLAHTSLAAVEFTAIAEAVGTATAAQTFTIEVNVPSGARIIGAQLRVDVALTSGDGGISWEAELNGGVAHTLGGGYAFAKDTQGMLMFDENAAAAIGANETDIRITCDSAKNFQAGGKVRAIVYYQDLVPMDAAP